MKNDQIILTFFKGRDEKIISRNKAGKICLLDINYCKENKVYVKDGDIWKCAVKEERENCIIVQPITKTLTAAESDEAMHNNAEKLQHKYKKESPGDRKTSNRS